MRPTALATVFAAQFREDKIEKELVRIISGAVGSTCGASKTTSGVWKAVGHKHPEVCVWNDGYENDSINFFSDIDQYMSIRSSMEVGTEPFFLACNGKGTHPREFFKRQHLGKNSFMSAVKTACKAEGIEVSGSKSWVTKQGLRGTLATILFDNGNSDSSLAMRTGHRDPRSLKSYQHLREREGINQRRDILGKENVKDEAPNKNRKVVGIEYEDAQRSRATVRNWCRVWWHCQRYTSLQQMKGASVIKASQIKILVLH